MVPRAHVGMNGSFGTIRTVFRPFAQNTFQQTLAKLARAVGSVLHCVGDRSCAAKSCDEMVRRRASFGRAKVEVEDALGCV